MSHYHKIATIIMRGFACYLLLWVVIEWAVIGAGTLLISFGLFSRNSVAFEVRLLASVVYLIAGLVLYYRSESLAKRISEDLIQNNSDGSAKYAHHHDAAP
jgi:hypothetical protein